MSYIHTKRRRTRNGREQKQMMVGAAVVMAIALFMSLLILGGVID